jgi:hypothetical protein
MNESPVCKQNYIQFHLIMNESLFVSKITFIFQQNFSETAGSSQHVGSLQWSWLPKFSAKQFFSSINQGIFQFKQLEYLSSQVLENMNHQ